MIVLLKPCYYDINDKMLLTEGKLMLAVAENHSLKPRVVPIKLTDYKKIDANQRKKIILETIGMAVA